MSRYALGSLSLALLAVAAHAQPTINVGTHQLEPNTAGQTIQIFVLGGQPVEVLNLSAQIADGGSAGGGVNVGPLFSNLDILNGTIFAPNNLGQFGGPGYPQLAIGSTITNSGTVAANGLLATLKVDTTGIWSGTYALNLGDTLNGATDFGDVHPFITDGTIHVVPEPSSMTLLGLGGLAALRRRRHRS